MHNCRLRLSTTKGECMQTINTAHHGPMEYVKSWRDSTGKHIALLVKGGYVHFSGSPVTIKGDLTDLITPGKDLDAALEWWKHRNDPPEVAAIQRIMLAADGGYEWENGSPIESAADIMNALPQGPQQEAVLAWHHQKTITAKRKENMAKVHEGNRIKVAQKKAEVDAKAKAEAEVKKAA